MYACGPSKITNASSSPPMAELCGFARAMCARSVPCAPRVSSIMNGRWDAIMPDGERVIIVANMCSLMIRMTSAVLRG
jgi:hypothetical protein